MTKLKIIAATGGFSGYLWRVSRGEESHLVYAMSNYEAAEAVGWEFGSCNVQEMKVVEA